MFACFLTSYWVHLIYTQDLDSRTGISYYLKWSWDGCHHHRKRSTVQGLVSPTPLSPSYHSMSTLSKALGWRIKNTRDSSSQKARARNDTQIPPHPFIYSKNLKFNFLHWVLGECQNILDVSLILKALLSYCKDKNVKWPRRCSDQAIKTDKREREFQEFREF